MIKARSNLAMKIPYNLGDIIEKRYRIVKILEQDRTQTTYEVEDLSDRHKAVAIVPFWQKILLIFENSANYSHPVEVENRSRKLIIKLASDNSQKLWLLLFLSLPSLIIGYYFWGLANHISFAHLFSTNLMVLVLLLSILIICIFLIIFRENYLEIDDNNFLIQWKYWRFKYQVTGKTQDITDLELRYQTVERDYPLGNGKADPDLITNPYCCVIWEGVRQHKFGAWLKEQEQEWLLEEISRFIMEKDDSSDI